MSKSRRAKAYKPRAVHLPVTGALFREFDTQLLISIAGLNGGFWNDAPRVQEIEVDWHIDGLSQIINLCAVAQAQSGTPDPRILGAAPALQRWLDAYVKNGRFIARDHDIATVKAAAIGCREYLARANGYDLKRALVILNSIPAQEVTNACIPDSGRAAPQGTAQHPPTQADDAGPGQAEPNAAAVPGAHCSLSDGPDQVEPQTSPATA